MNAAILSAAVADFTPETVFDIKKKRGNEDLILRLKPTKDIAFSLGKMKNDNQILVGFALETENEMTNATLKLQNKNADFIVLNSMNNKDAGFNKATNQITIISKDGIVLESDVLSKKKIAEEIIRTIQTYFFSNQ